MTKPIVMIILDGAADVPNCTAYQATPLEVARTPWLNKLTKRGHAGLLSPIGPTVEPESHSGILNLLGYPVMPPEVPRGPIEALGCGLPFDPGDLAIRVNFGTRDETTGLIVDRRVCRSLNPEDGKTLCGSVEAGVNEAKLDFRVRMFPVRSYRACTVIKAKGIQLSDAITNTDPGYPVEDRPTIRDGGYETIKCRPLADNERARITAAYLNQFVTRAEDILRSHPLNRQRRSDGRMVANAILTRGPGSSLPRLRPLRERFGLDPTFLASNSIERGVAAVAGCKFRNIPCGQKISQELEGLSLNIEKLALPDTLTIAHVKGPDEFGHDGDFAGKVACLEKIDTDLLGSLVPRVVDRSIIVITADHATPCCLRRHSAAAVPFVISGPGVIENDARNFSERECAPLKTSISKGSQLLKLTIDFAT